MSKHVKSEKKEPKPHETAVAKEMRELVGDMKNKFAVEAQRIIHEIMPAKVVPYTAFFDMLMHGAWKHGTNLYACYSITGSGTHKAPRGGPPLEISRGR
jgi:hypothetical protein